MSSDAKVAAPIAYWWSASTVFRARCVRYRHVAIAMMFVSLSVWDARTLWSYGAL